MTWSEFLALLSAPNGIAAAIGVVLSLVIEFWPEYEQLEARQKRLVFLGLCFVIPVAATTLGVLTAGWPLAWEPTFWHAVLAGGIAFGGGTVAHARKL